MNNVQTGATIVSQENGNGSLPAVALQRVTPALAQDWLDRTSLENRKLSPGNIAKYARDIIAGRWKVNGETIKLTRDGQVIDGQNRLTAIIEAGMPIITFVARGVDPTTMPTVDVGRPRSFGDVLTIQGRTNAVLLAAVAGWLARYQGGNILSNHPISHQELEDTVASNPDLVESVRLIVAGTKIVPPAALAFVHYMASREHPALADDFVYAVHHGVSRSGEGLRQDHPVFRLRERLLLQRGTKTRLPRYEILALIIRAWTLFRDGRTTKVLRWRSTGPAAEPFPDFK